jgi:hypothetical protein
VRKLEISKVVSLAKLGRKSTTNPDGYEASDGWMELFSGSALPGFVQKFATIDDCAAMVSYQAMCWNGTWDSEELDSCCQILKRWITLVGRGSYSDAERPCGGGSHG